VVCYGYPAWILVVSGGVGTGYTYTGGKGGLAIHAMVEADLAPILVGKDARRVERLYEDMTWHVHYVARGGVASFAVSAVDIALWDLKCKCAGIATYMVPCATVCGLAMCRGSALC
jgi:L-alanine-DL-glutamate epimerase-like enolase superfamily enzyme